MNIRALQAFNAVVSEGSVTAAARVMNLSQPAVSRLIAVLEAELQLTLFKREKKRLHLTDQGTAFLREAGRILAGLSEIPAIAAEIRTKTTSLLRVVSMPRTALSLVAPCVARFTRLYPDVKVSLDVRSHRELESWITGREYDLSFGNVPISIRSAVTTPLVRTALEVLMPADHPLAQREHVDLKDLRHETIVQNFPGQLLRRQTDAMFEAQGVQIEKELLAGTSVMTEHLVANKAGVAIIDRLSTLAMDERLVTSRPLLPAQWVTFGVIRHREDAPSPHVTALIDLLRERIADCAKAGSIVPIVAGETPAPRRASPRKT